MFNQIQVRRLFRIIIIAKGENSYVCWSNETRREKKQTKCPGWPKLHQVLPSMDPTFCRTIFSTEFLQVLAFIFTIPTSHVGKVSLQYWKRYKRDFCSKVIYFVNVRCCTYQAFGTSFGECLYLAIVN